MIGASCLAMMLGAAGARTLQPPAKPIMSPETQEGQLPPSAREQGAATPPIAAQGAAVMDRLKRTNAGRKGAADAVPISALPVPSPVERERAQRALAGRIDPPGQEARARAAVDKARAGAEANRQAMLARLHQALGLEPPDSEALAAVGRGTLERRWIPVLFVSSAMPISTLRNYAGQLERAGGVMAFRGMPGGLRQVRPMAALAARILRRDPGCEGPGCAMRDVQLIVDPILFRQHGVSGVPALGLVPGDPTQPYCEREENSARAAHLVLGDAALDGMLEAYARLGGGEEVRDAQARLSAR